MRDALLDSGELHAAAVFRIGAHDHVHAGMNRAGDLHLRLDGRAAEPIEHDLLDALPHLGVVAVARHVDEAGIKAVERIAAHQNAHRAPLIQVDDSAHDADQVLHIGLEQLVARIGFQHIQHGLAVVAVRVETEVLDDPLDFAAQDRNVARTAIVRTRSPQSQKPMLARHAAAAVEGLDADVVEILGAVHRCDRVGFRDVQQSALACSRAHIAS